MGILSDLFGAGKRRDEAQDARIAALEARPAGDAETLAAMQAAIDGLAGAETVDDVARAAVAGSAAAVQALHERVAVIEAEFAALPTDGGIVVPEIEP